MKQLSRYSSLNALNMIINMETPGNLEWLSAEVAHSSLSAVFYT